jgi:hypothetical protein
MAEREQGEKDREQREGERRSRVNERGREQRVEENLRESICTSVYYCGELMYFSFLFRM